MLILKRFLIYSISLYVVGLLLWISFSNHIHSNYSVNKHTSCEVSDSVFDLWSAECRLQSLVEHAPGSATVCLI